MPETRFPADYYLVEGHVIRAVEALMQRLYTEQRMDADLMRDWGNKLCALLDHMIEYDIKEPKER